jgi:hypothetical protein
MSGRAGIGARRGVGCMVNHTWRLDADDGADVLVRF